MFAEHDLLCKQYIEQLESEHKKDVTALTDKEEEEKKKKRKERQAEIMKKFSMQMASFKMDVADIEDEEAEQKEAELEKEKKLNPFPSGSLTSFFLPSLKDICRSVDLRIVS